MRRKTIFLKVMGFAAAIATLLATVCVSSASCSWLYQPKVPKCIMK